MILYRRNMFCNNIKCFVGLLMLVCYCLLSSLCFATREVIQLIHHNDESSSGGGRISTLRNATAGFSFDLLDDVTSIQLKDTDEEQTTYFILSQLQVRFNIDNNDDSKNNKDMNINNNNTIGISDTIWRGIIVGENRTGFCTLFQSSYDQSITGTITTENLVYEFLQKPNGIKEVRYTYWDEYPNDHDFDYDIDNVEADEDEDNNIVVVSKQQQQVISSTSVVTNQSITNDDGYYIPSLSESTTTTKWVVTKTGVDVSQSIPIQSYLLEIMSMERQYKSQQQKSELLSPKQDGLRLITVDVLIIVTNRAMCEYASQDIGCSYGIYNQPIRNKITVIEDETNAAFEYSLIDVRINIIGPIFLSRHDYDFDSSSESLNELQTNQTYRKWQDLYGADLISVIGGKGGACGRGVLFGIMSVVTWSCLGQYSFTHEIGHNFGCRHEIDACKSKTGYAFGYTYSTLFRTVMSYSCIGGGCPRVLFFSTPIQRYKGIIIGTVDADNARMIRTRALSIARERNETKITCPIFSGTTHTNTQCLQKNQMYKNYFGLFCFNKCISESWYNWHNFFGWKCGKCPQ